jgi:hypothetical protein
MIEDEGSDPAALADFLAFAANQAAHKVAAARKNTDVDILRFIAILHALTTNSGDAASSVLFESEIIETRRR